MSSSTSTFHRSDDAQAYRANASFVYNAKNTGPVLALLDAQPGDRILDLGCGSGELTRVVASLVGSEGSVLGVDASQDMIAAAQADKTPVAEAGVQPSFDVADGCDLASYLASRGLVGAFDRVFSNAALHWMKRSPGSVLRGVHAALRPGGVFAAELGGFLNVIAIRGGCHAILRRHGQDPDKVDPWYFPTPESYAALLEAASAEEPFSVETCELVPRPTPLPTGIRGFLKTFCGPFLNALPSDQARDEAVAELEDLLRPDMYDAETDQWTAMYVRLRVKATKPPASAASLHPAIPLPSGPSGSGSTPTATAQPPCTAPIDPSLLSKLTTTSAAAPSAQAAAERIHARFLNRRVLAHVPDGRVFRGTFVCIDDGSNLIVSHADELRLHGGGGTEGNEMEKGTGLSTEERVVASRFVGMVMIKGEDLVRIEVEEDLPPEAAGVWGSGRPQAHAWPTDPEAYM